MASIADITVKKADGSTNVVYVAAVPSAGDKSPAVWTQNAFSGIQGFRPRFELTTSNNGANTIRQARVKFFYPSLYTDASTNLQKLNASIGFDGTAFLPKGLTTTEWLEAWAQLGNLLVSTLVRSSVQDGYAPT